MAGHSAIYGDRFSYVKGACSSTEKGAKALYYPISPPENEKYNAEHPAEYNLDQLPMRNEQCYWDTIKEILAATSKNAAAAITKRTGISRMPLAAASPAFLHPSFFPLDPFHLFYENIMAFLWDLWTKYSLPSESIHLSPGKAAQFGRLVVEAMATLPPCFCGPVRDPFLKRHSQYKIYEWMALLHWYVLPIGMELGFNSLVLENFAYVADVIEAAMTIKRQTNTELEGIFGWVKTFFKGFQKSYIGEKAENIYRFRLCIFQLIHVPQHIEWNGSIRLGSQATVERAIGEMGHKIHSKKAPFKNLANLIYERELLKALSLYYPELHAEPKKPNKTTIKEVQILNKERHPGQQFHSYLLEICKFLGVDFDPQLNLRRWAKLRLSSGDTLGSLLSGTLKPPTRSSRYFEAENHKDTQPTFGEALAFFEVVKYGVVVIYHLLVKQNQVLRRWRGVWSSDVKVIQVSSIKSLIGIWAYNDWVYALRKHPGLDWLTPAEHGEPETDGQDGEEEEND
ncbi:hypothetical protein JAAARDRAFT_143997 [Jaapia argillacea MUCL 33604]|uniref:Uncharacterized protein n=1 Tax=Jaapia argillacea MUCL 33604 TaxID=933084 RepID=A0A067PEY7_9AGAM|nr:hypothetical protein JAAARDRAFT_143997 [Jaapia argillacea MUCL 33604]